jgi:hypothetical protein
MRHRAVALFVCIAVSIAFSPAPVHALPQFSTLTSYYDSSQQPAGWSFRSCSGSWQQDGTLAGEWKEVDIQYCDAPWDYITEYYHYCNGQWVQVSYLFDPSC